MSILLEFIQAFIHVLLILLIILIINSLPLNFHS
jgi:hypothetical protein